MFSSLSTSLIGFTVFGLMSGSIVINKVALMPNPVAPIQSSSSARATTASTVQLFTNQTDRPIACQNYLNQQCLTP